jgi:hypothetical protein
MAYIVIRKHLVVRYHRAMFIVKEVLVNFCVVTGRIGMIFLKPNTASFSRY